MRIILPYLTSLAYAVTEVGPNLSIVRLSRNYLVGERLLDGWSRDGSKKRRERLLWKGEKAENDFYWLDFLSKYLSLS